MYLTTTGTTEHESLGIVSLFHFDSQTKRRFGKELTYEELIPALIRLLSERGKELGADAVIGIQIEPITQPGMVATATNYLLYGTAVKLVKSK